MVVAPVTPQSLKDIARRWIAEGWQKGNADMVFELHSPDFVDHDSDGRAHDREGFRDGIRQLFTAFPDFNAMIDDLVVDVSSGKVAVRWSASGTHVGPFMGVQPAGSLVTFSGIEIIRIDGGRIVERWGEWDGIDLLRQMRAGGR